MTATVITIYGLRDRNLAAFKLAQSIVAANLCRIDPELALRQMRAHLEAARQAFPADVERADALGAIAANKLAVAIGVQR